MRVFDCGPRTGRDRLDCALHQRVLAHGDADLRPALHCGEDGRAAVVRGVGAQEDRPGRVCGSQAVDGTQGVGHDPAGAAGGTGGALAQPGRDDHRSAAGSGDGRRSGVCAVGAARNRDATASSGRTWPNVNCRGKLPSVDGA